LSNDPSLIQFLAAAGVFGATLAFILQALGSWLQRQRELHGLLRLLSAELKQNSVQTYHFSRRPDAMQNHFIPGWESTVWKENAPRVAQLISESDFEVLVQYYKEIITVQVLRAAMMASDDQTKEEYSTLVPFLKDERFPQLQDASDEALRVLDNILQRNWQRLKPF